MTEIRCKMCGNDHARMFDTTVYGKKKRHVYCHVCSNSWVEQERDDDEGDSDR